MNYLTLLVLAYLAALLWFGIRGGTRERELNAFLTAGGSAGALLCAFSLVSTIIGGSATLGMGALAQKVGPRMCSDTLRARRQKNGQAPLSRSPGQR